MTIKTKLILIIYFIIHTGAYAQANIDISQAWFEPQLTVNNQSNLCKSIFDEYVNYYTSTSTDNPFENVGQRTQKKKNALDFREFREIGWRKYQTSNSRHGDFIRVADWYEGTKYLSVVEKSSGIGWRVPSYKYYILSRPLTSEEVADGMKEGFSGKEIRYMAKSEGPGKYDILHRDDPRYLNTQANWRIQVVNVLKSKSGTLLVLSLKDPARPKTERILVTSLLSSTKLNLQCEFTTAPSQKAIIDELSTIPDFQEFSKLAFDVMGSAGRCGSINAHGSAVSGLREGFRTLITRPWIHTSNIQEYDFSSWGTKGLWNYKKYKLFEKYKGKVHQSLEKKYINDYSFGKDAAFSLAVRALDAGLYKGFNHGTSSSNDIHLLILRGSPTSQVSKILPEESEYNNRFIKFPNGKSDSLLTFAIGQPELVKLLLDKGYNPNKINDFGKTPLMYAAQFDDLESARLLIEYGASTELSTFKPYDDCNFTLNRLGLTALHYAARYASAEFVSWMIQAGAIVSAKDSRGKSPQDYIDRYRLTSKKENLTSVDVVTSEPFSDNQLSSIKVLLKPPSQSELEEASIRENSVAEALYSEGKVKESFYSLKKALSLSPNNETAVSNMSLIAFKMGNYGESAEAADYLIKNSTNPRIRASAYFNLALACKTNAIKKGYHMATLFHGGVTFCGKSYNSPYKGVLYNLLESNKENPTLSRSNAIKEFFLDSKKERGKWLCRTTEELSDMHAVYITGSNIYFLVSNGKQVKFNKRIFILKDRSNTERTLDIESVHVLSLANGYSVIQWNLVIPSLQGLLVLDQLQCDSDASSY